MPCREIPGKTLQGNRVPCSEQEQNSNLTNCYTQHMVPHTTATYIASAPILYHLIVYMSYYLDLYW